MDIDLQIVDVDVLRSEYSDLTDLLAQAQDQRDALVKELAEAQARISTLQRRVDAMTNVVDTGDESDPIKAAMLNHLRQQRASLTEMVSEELRDFIWMDEVVSAGVRAVLDDDAPDEDFEAQCIEIEKRLHWVALIGVVLDDEVIFRVLSDTVSFAKG